MLQFIYNVGMKICAQTIGSFTGSTEGKKLSNWEIMVAVYVVGDKYGIPGLQEAIMTAIVPFLQRVTRPETLTSLADAIYDNTMATDGHGQPDKMRIQISGFIQEHLTPLLANPNAKEALLGNVDLNSDLLQHVANASGQPTKLKVSLKRQREEDNEDADQGLRRSNRATRSTHSYKVPSLSAFLGRG